MTLSDFTSKSCLTAFSYGWLWFLAILSVAVYAADTFTAVNLLAFNRWSSQINPTIPFSVSKWIFAVCIILSWVLCAYEWLRAIQAIRSGGVGRSYLDPLAVIIQSLRVDSTGKGWRRFLVFAELTKSKKGADYVALFTYFQLQGAVRILLAEAPRQVVNALTLYSVMKANLIPDGQHAASHGHSAFDQFWINVQILADKNKEQAAILSTMLFTLVIWAISALSLIIACLLYIGFLWHYIPTADGGLSNYCRRKIDRRLEKIVTVKVQKALEKQEVKQRRVETMAIKNGHTPPQFTRKPTLPVLEDSHQDYSGLHQPPSREMSQTSLPPYYRGVPTPNGFSKSGLFRQPTLPSFSDKSLDTTGPVRSVTQSSGFSYITCRSERPLLAEAADMGYAGLPAGQTRPLSEIDRNNSGFSSGPSVSRSLTEASQMSKTSGFSNIPLPSRIMTGSTQPPYNPAPTPKPVPIRSMTCSSQGTQRFLTRAPTSQSYDGPTQSHNRNTSLSRNFSLLNRRSTLASTSYDPTSTFRRPSPPPYKAERPTYEIQLPQLSFTSQGSPPQQTVYRPYTPYHPSLQEKQPQSMHTRDPYTGNPVPILQHPQPPRRNDGNEPNFSGGISPLQRVGTAPLPTAPYANSVYDEYRNNGGSYHKEASTVRPGTAAPRMGGGALSGQQSDW